MPIHPAHSSVKYEGNSTNQNPNNSVPGNEKNNLSILSNFGGQAILQAQAQGQIQQAPNNNNSAANSYTVAQFLSALNSSAETNIGDKMNGASSHSGHMNVQGNTNPGVPVNNVKMNGQVNNSNGNGTVPNAPNNANQNSMMNFPMLNPGLFRHLSYDAATAALLMNPQAAAHAAAAAQAAVATVAQQFASNQPQAQQAPQQPQQAQQHHPQQHHPQQQTLQQPHHNKLPQTSLNNQSHEVAPSTPIQNVNIPTGGFSMNNMSNMNIRNNTNNIPMVPGSNVGAAPSVPTNVKQITPENNNMGVSQALQVLMNSPATAQAVAAAVANGMKIQSPQNRNQHSSPPLPHTRPMAHSHTPSHTHVPSHVPPHAPPHAPPHVPVTVPVGATNIKKQPRPILSSGSSAIHGMPPPSKNLGIQSMISIQNLRGTTKKPLLTTMGGNPLENMRNWKLEELEAHVRLLQESNQTVPQPLALLLADARRKEEKKTAKRVANRRSACTSRARKKALVEEMTRTNAKLKRQALILSLLPDLVVAITVEGEITFCSAQVERVLRHSVNDLVGSNLMDILLPASKEALQHLISMLVIAEANEMNSKTGRNKDDNGGSSSSSAGSSNDVAIVSEQSFPLSVVKVMGPNKNSPKKSTSNGNNATNSSSNGSSDEKGKNNLTNLSLGNSSSQSGSDEDRAARSNQSSTGNNRSSGIDDSTASPQAGGTTCDETSSSEAKLRASEALNRNVQHHKDQLCKDKMERNTKHTDDVTGASVTANNADARLSSLQHCPRNGYFLPQTEDKNSDSKKNALAYENLEVQSSSSGSSDSLLSGVEEKPTSKDNGASPQPPARASNENESDDSGFRAGSENSGSSDDSSTNQQNGQRPKPLAPTCNICLIRDDLTTIWCEVTSSIRTRSLSDEAVEITGTVPIAKPVGSTTSSSKPVSEPRDTTPQETVKELLLCLRPIREGEEKVTEEFRFKAKASKPTENAVSDKDDTKKGDSENTNINGLNPTIASGVRMPVVKRPMKKRPFAELKSSKITMTNGSAAAAILPGHNQPVVTDVTSATEQSVVESLMLMSHKKKRSEK